MKENRYNLGVTILTGGNCMRQYQMKKTEEIKKETSKIICNQCGKEIPVVNGQEQ